MLEIIDMACPNFVSFHIKSVKLIWPTVEIQGANWNLPSRYESLEIRSHKLKQMVGPN
ncbi:unnamed protein product [Arabidopsis thaliana]|nr:unnamed protein product [Arabidopsis thaliana]